MAEAAIIAAIASTTYQIDQSQQARRQAGQVANGARLDAESAQAEVDRKQQAEAQRAEMLKAYNRNKAAYAATQGRASTILTGPQGLGDVSPQNPAVGKTLLGA